MSDIVITVIFSCITVSASIIGPVISNHLQAKSKIQLRKIEVMENSLRPAVKEFMLRFSAVRAGPSSMDDIDLVAAALDLSSMVHSEQLRDDIISLAKDATGHQRPDNAELDARMSSIAAALSKELFRYTRDKHSKQVNDQ